MTSSTSSAELQQQMRELRESLGDDSEAMVQQARAELNWRTFVTNHPWLTLIAAASAGYLLVPRRHRAASVDAEALGRTIGEAMRDAPGAAGPPPAPPPGLIRGILNSLAMVVVREGLSVGSELVREFMRQRGGGAGGREQP